MVVRQSAVRDDDAIKRGSDAFYWCWCVICRAMRFQKLKAQMSAHCESGHLCIGGEEAETLVVPWLYDSVLMVLTDPSWHGSCSKAIASGTAGICIV